MDTEFDKEVNRILKESQYSGIVGLASDVVGSAGNVLKRFMNTELYQIASGLDPTRISAMPNAVNKGYEFIKKPNLFSATTFLLSLVSASPFGGQIVQIARIPDLALRMLQVPYVIGDMIKNKKPIIQLLQKENGMDMQQSVNKALGMLYNARTKVDNQAKQLKIELDKEVL